MCAVPAARAAGTLEQRGQAMPARDALEPDSLAPAMEKTVDEMDSERLSAVPQPRASRVPVEPFAAEQASLAVGTRELLSAERSERSERPERSVLRIFASRLKRR